MSKNPNLRSTEDDPEDAPWKNNELHVREPGILLHQYYMSYYNLGTAHPVWQAKLGGTSTTLGGRATPVHLGSSGSITITPGSGSLTTAPPPPEINVTDTVRIEDGNESSSSPSGPQAPSGLNISTSNSGTSGGNTGVDWFTRLTCFIPKEIREPWHGDLLEDRARMTEENYSRLRIELATGIQLLWLLLHSLWAKITSLWLIYTRLS